MTLIMSCNENELIQPIYLAEGRQAIIVNLFYSSDEVADIAIVLYLKYFSSVTFIFIG